MRSLAWLALVVTFGTIGAGCGLFDPDITNFDLFIKDKDFTIDTDQWELNGVDAFTSTDCSVNDVCAVAVEQSGVCAPGQCFGSCNTQTDTCQLQVVMQLWQGVDMSADNPEINTVANEPVVSVTIDSIAYQVISNTMNVETPMFTVYAAPSTTMSTGDPEAQAVGVIPPVPPATLIPETDIIIEPSGQDILASKMGDYMTPFNIIVGSSIMIRQGDSVPQGMLAAVIRVRAHAGL
jgi:hypothetical protein